ncbi:DNA-binding protein Alba [Candidatus Methanoliparum sp. LAM-1]|uniref:DNA-binding protein Alba n=1 Tax=Candidatus Methanoliparum sp. LAM-1 TaxID=2874846 RepID=UPI001E53FAFC|nr:DNA-binding protein Alba [Candidatus Methanoliparum sp. LAM-1]BDC36487.1 DNA-binding protein [Candidatus Methanoliparum sp. LAM-1]BDC36662.1 DNA-binding protein [Candidatus Methanoliparum sp. LAM-1]
MAEDNVVYIGKKPVMNYVLATITVFNEGSNEAVIKARGKAISRAVDTAEVIRTRFLPNLKVKDIKIGTEEISREDGKSSNISWIEIYLSAN